MAKKPQIIMKSWKKKKIKHLFHSEHIAGVDDGKNI